MSTISCPPFSTLSIASVSHTMSVHSTMFPIYQPFELERVMPVSSGLKHGLQIKQCYLLVEIAPRLYMHKNPRIASNPMRTKPHFSVQYWAEPRNSLQYCADKTTHQRPILSGTTQQCPILCGPKKYKK